MRAATRFLLFVAIFAILLLDSRVFAASIYFENQNYSIDLANGNVNANFTIVNNLQKPAVFGYFTFYSYLYPSNVEIYINGKPANNKYIHLASYKKYTTITYDHLWQPLSPGQTLNISLKYKINPSEQGVLFKEIEITPAKLFLKSNLSVKKATLTIKAPNRITYSNYPKYQISSSENSVTWQDNGFYNKYKVEYSALPFFRNNLIPGYIIFWLIVLFVVIVGLYLYEKRAPPIFVDVENILKKENHKTKRTTKKKHHKK